MKTITQVVQNLVKPYIDNQDQAVESNIAPVETDATSSTGSYSQGEQLILNKILYDVTAAITVGDPLEVGTNIAVAPKISAAIGGKQEQIEVSSMPTASASYLGKVLIYIGATGTYTSGQSYQCVYDSETTSYSWEPTQAGTISATNVTYNGTTSGSPETNAQDELDKLEDDNAKEAATRSELGAKNRLPITLASLKQIATAGTWANNVYTENGIDFTINTDASDYVTSVVVSGTASGVATINLLGTNAEYASNDFAGMILTGCPSGGGNDNYRTVVFIGDNQDGTGHTTQYEDGTGVTIGSNAYVRIYLRVASGTDLTTPITFKPMIRLATDSDATYQPYAKTNLELTEDSLTWDNLSEVGAVNYLDSDASTTVHSSSGLTFTVNSDKTVTVSATSETYPFTSTALANFALKLKPEFSDKLPLKLSGCPSGGDSSNGYNLQYSNYSNTDNKVVDTGDGAIISTQFNYTTYPNAGIRIQVLNGTTLTGPLTFKPMLTEPSYNGPYVPYAKTNKELTDDVADKLLIKTALSEKVSVTADGTKTLQTLLNELHTALASVISSLGNNEILKVIDCQLDDGSHLIPFRSDFIYTKASTLGNMQFSTFQITTGQNVYIRSVIISGTLATNTYLQMKISTSATEYSARESEIPTSNSKVYVFYQILEKIS